MKSLIRVDLGSLETTTAAPKPTGSRVIVHAAVDGGATLKKLEDTLSKSYKPRYFFQFVVVNVTKLVFNRFLTVATGF